MIMLKKMMYLVCLAIGFSACDGNYQYDVRVVNETGSDLKLVYKTTVNDTRGTVEETITIPNGDTKVIIKTVDIDLSKNKDEQSSNNCKLVAEYINAFMGDKPSTIKWCSEAIKYEMVDIGQAQFLIKYTANDF